MGVLTLEIIKDVAVTLGEDGIISQFIFEERLTIIVFEVGDEKEVLFGGVFVEEFIEVILSGTQVVVEIVVAIAGPDGDSAPAKICDARAVILGEACNIITFGDLADFRPHGGFGTIVNGVEGVAG